MTYRPFITPDEACRRYGIDAAELADYMREGLQWLRFEGAFVIPTVMADEFMADKYPKLRAVA